MHISKTHCFVFLDVPKTASLTLDTIFESDYGAELIRPPKISGLYEKHNRVIPDWAKNYTRITCVRNPFERITSYYFFGLKQKKLMDSLGIKTFDDFIDHCLVCTNNPDNLENGLVYRFFPAWKFLQPMGYDIVLKQETLHEGFNKLPFVNNQHVLPRKNFNTTNVGWSEVYSTERRDKIIEWAGKDFEQFGYDKDYK